MIDKQPKTHYQTYRHIQHVLLIDDNPLTNEINERTLISTKLVQKVSIASDAEQAIKLLLDLKKAGESLPELIFLDIIMPGIDGWEFLDLMQTRLGSIRRNSVVMLTSSPDVSHLLQCSLRPEIMDFVIKPLTDFECARILEQYIHQSRFEKA